MAGLSWLDYQLEAELFGLPATKAALTLQADTDPFSILDGNPRYEQWAQWFTSLFQQCYPDARPGSPVHLRRIHYRLVSSETPIPMVGSVAQDYVICEFWVVPAQGNKKKGQVLGDVRPNVYLNDEDCWLRLCKAAKWARHLGYIRGDLIEDNRSPDAIGSLDPIPLEVDPGFYVSDDWEDVRADILDGCRDRLPVRPAFPSAPEFPRLAASVGDFRWWDPPAPHHLEIWVEKSTMNDVLQPICERHGIFLQALVGESSLTRTNDLVQRIAGNGGKPVRIFYLSDFDPAGNSMPCAMSRRLEHKIRSENPEADVQVTHLLLTLDQVHHYNLPTSPIKPSEKRQQVFMRRFGVDGAVELDALEALYPGELEKLVMGALEPYIEAKRDWRADLRSFDSDLDDLADEANAGAINEFRERINRNRDWYKAIRDEFTAEYEKARAKAVVKLQELAEDHADLAAEMEIYLENNEPEIDLAQPEPNTVYETRPLFDSEREYLDQMHHYRLHKGIDE
jgi:hypothetical protein